LKPFALVDSNIVIYAMIKGYPTKLDHEKCLSFLEKGLKGELNYILSMNPIIVVEVFSALRKLLSSDEAENRVGSLLRLRRLGFLSISKENCLNSVRWAKEKNVPINDALIGANSLEHASIVYTLDDHFKKLEEYGVKPVNPLKP
jgi:predicted nucleic acid-binding protein